MSGDDDLPGDLAHVTPTYRRALWIVVGLNVGYGLVEMVGGFVSGSQALKADALDFLGDGLISFLGLLAIGWSSAWRARSALTRACSSPCSAWACSPPPLTGCWCSTSRKPS